MAFHFENIGDVIINSETIDSNFDWVSVLDNNNCSLPFYLQNTNLYYWFTFIEDSKVLYAQYNSCREMTSKPFRVFTDELVDFMDSNETNKFIFDMRLNGGGNSSIARPLIDEIKQRQGINNDGHLFIVIGRRTFSSAILNSLEFKNETNSLFVGEASGGKPNHYGEVRSFTLPNARLIVSYSTKYFVISSEDTPSLNPDITVELSFSDYANCNDPVLEEIIENN